jgi:hypothetical protein
LIYHNPDAYIPDWEKKIIVESPEEAGMIMYYRNATEDKGGSYWGLLIRINLEKSKIDTLEIPTVIFQTTKPDSSNEKARP